ncbi:glutamine dumper 2-like protein [Tanacetum coccineum]|uniref:Glutamine dumper 2-like protein n=1 Tax=Tanacetum coccineum TaxID=301880 RepID=A0ABQ5FT23_9ASTR
MGSSQVSVWRFDSPLIYLFGGISVILALITVALVILACSQRRRRLAGENGGDIESGGDNEKSIKAVHNGGDAADVSPKMVVIMAGDEVPTYLATPSEVASTGSGRVKLKKWCHVSKMEFGTRNAMTPEFQLRIAVGIPI